MKDVIDKIFLRNSFVEKSIKNPFENDISFWGNYSKESTNFYLVIYAEEMAGDFLTERVPEYYNAIKKIHEGYDERIDKNLSMLVCLEDNDISTAKYKKACEIEEDPYFFKKYLLSYGEDFERIKRDILEGEDINTTINGIINDVAKFHQYKEGSKTDEVILYDTCVKLMTKIPFISLVHNQSRLDDLSKSILICLEKDNLAESRNTILQYAELGDDDEFVEKIVHDIGLENNENE